ncbi:hypothetical protein [Streptomyces sp. NPDC058486]|uniref:hypothetical protein n=1 Tax=unclassified Streptomyces TaxID=2593676 RepID=UPI003664B374
MHLTHSDEPGTVGIESVRPLHDRNTLACAQTYTAVLDWPITDGHRYRRRAGCTCPAATACPAPGAHPRPGPLTPLRPEDIESTFTQAPGAGIIAPCRRFDAVALPHPLGTGLLLMLDRFTLHTPSLATTAGPITILVEPGTGHRLAEAYTDVVVHTGPDAWIALPPSHNIRWDTPPVPHRPLPHALTVRPHLSRVVTLARRAGDLP